MVGAALVPPQAAFLGTRPPGKLTTKLAFGRQVSLRSLCFCKTLREDSGRPVQTLPAPQPPQSRWAMFISTSLLHW